MDIFTEMYYLLAMQNRCDLLWTMAHGEAYTSVESQADYAAFYGQQCWHYARLAMASFKAAEGGAF